jgi:hypothetical protein
MEVIFLTITSQNPPTKELEKKKRRTLTFVCLGWRMKKKKKKIKKNGIHEAKQLREEHRS